MHLPRQRGNNIDLPLSESSGVIIERLHFKIMVIFASTRCFAARRTVMLSPGITLCLIVLLDTPTHQALFPSASWQQPTEPRTLPTRATHSAAVLMARRGSRAGRAQKAWEVALDCALESGQRGADDADVDFCARPRDGRGVGVGDVICVGVDVKALKTDDGDDADAGKKESSGSLEATQCEGKVHTRNRVQRRR